MGQEVVEKSHQLSTVHVIFWSSFICSKKTKHRHITPSRCRRLASRQQYRFLASRNCEGCWTVSTQRLSRVASPYIRYQSLEIAKLIAKDPALGRKLTPNRPEVLAQVDFAIQSELALSLRDFMIRRTQLFFRDDNQGLDCCSTVAERMKTI